MTREELKEHCLKEIKMCEMWAHSQGKRPCGEVYEEHKLILELLEQEPTNVLKNIKRKISKELARMYMYRNYADGLGKAIELIDKYKEEIESQESKDNNG